MNVGNKINHLTLLEIREPKIRTNGAKRPMGLFSCDCGSESVKSIESISSGRVKQCWDCGHKSARLKITTHNNSKHPLYRKWQDMKNRCYNKNVQRYECYGGRGITVCDEWKNSFQNYYDWCISNGYEKGLTLDRIDVNGNYEPSNCKYVTQIEQGFNKRNTFYVTINGNKYSLAKLMYDNNMSTKYHTVWCGLKKGKSIEYYIKKLNINLPSI
jgi:hypothetical protein